MGGAFGWCGRTFPRTGAAVDATGSVSENKAGRCINAFAHACVETGCEMCARFWGTLTATQAHRLPMFSSRRALVCHPAAPLPVPILSRMGDFRLRVNRGLREALEKDLTAKGSLSKFREGVARENRIHGAHARIAMDLALSWTKVTDVGFAMA